MSDQQSAEEPLLTVHADSIFLNGPLSFKDAQSIHQWANDQIGNVAEQVRPVSGVYNGEELIRPFRSIAEITRDGTAIDIAKLKSLFEEIGRGASFSRASRYDSTFKNLHLTDWERFGFLCSTFNIDPKPAFESPQLRKPPARALFASGYATAVSMHLAGNVTLSPARGKIDAALEASLKLVDDINAKFQSFDKEFDKESANRERLMQQTSERVSDFVKSNANHMRSIAREHREEMKRIRRSFEEYTALSGPISYWEKRAFWNYAVASGAIFLFIAIGAFAIWRLEADGPALLIRIAEIVQQFPERLQSPLSFLILLSMPTLLILWLLKFPARIFKEHLHIANDARHRKTLITTYLSLLREPTNPITPSERQYALQSIFGNSGAPSQDDPIPVITEIVGKKSAS